MPITLLIVDALNLIRRIHAAIPSEESTEKNQQTLNNTCLALTNMLSTHTPSHALCVFDNQDKTWRHDCYPEYKQGRKPTPESLRLFLPEIKEAIKHTGIQSLAIANQEADDIIASIASKACISADVIIVSTDKTFYQLLPLSLRIYHHFEKRFADITWVLEKFGVQPHQLTSYWGLVGDSTNGLKGVPSIGPKTAKQLLNHGRQLDTLIELAKQEPYPDDINQKSLRKLLSFKEDAKLAHRLTTLKRDIQIGISLKDLRLKALST